MVEGAYLWDARMGNNMGHALGEEVMTLHNSLCRHAGGLGGAVGEAGAGGAVVCAAAAAVGVAAAAVSARRWLRLGWGHACRCLKECWGRGAKTD